MPLLKQIISYLIDLPVQQVESPYSGTLKVVWSQGRKVLNTSQVNYSFQSLHRIFKWSFKKSNLPSSIHRVLILGLGGGSIVEILRKKHQIKAPIHVVEIDDTIISLATQEFHIHKFDPVQIYHQDAFLFISQMTQTYDLICMDVFIHDKVPANLIHHATLEKLINQLTPNGKLFINTMLNDFLHEDDLVSLKQILQSKPTLHSIGFEILNPEENNRMVVITK